MSLSTAPRAHPRSRLAGVLLAGALVTSAYGIPFSAPAAAAPLGLHVVGNQLYKDSQPFLPRGFNMIGLLAPAWCTQGQGKAARDHFGQAAMDAAKDWNANTLRFQISQRGLADSAIAQADRDAYLVRVADGVALARSNGFMVILSMQDQSNGCGPAHPLPSDQTATAWNVLAPQFQYDPYIMFELFNEPNTANNADGWNQWQHGGSFPSANQGSPAIGHQALVDQLRGLGVSNVLIADGLNLAERLAGMPLLSDPLNGLMYGIHPYYFSVGQSWWDAQYGYLTPTHPVIATEWNYLASKCGTSAEQMAPAHLAYLRDHNIGLLAHAFDAIGTIITKDWAWTPTDCATTQGGSGRLVKDFFATQADPDSLPPTAPTGLLGTAASAVQVDLTWDASSDNLGVAKYHIRRNGVTVGETSDLAYSDLAVASNTSYSYAVRAVDAAGNVSPDSDSVTVTTPESQDAEPPTAPANLQATVASSTQVDLSWEASTDDTGVLEYHVLRDSVEIGETTGLTYRDDATEAHETYGYTVVAVDAAGNVSEASNSVSVTPPDTIAPKAPTGLQGSAVNSARVDLSWQGSTDNIGVTGYQVVRDGVVIATATGGLSYTDATVAANRTYTYTVRGVDAAGNAGADSNAAVVRTPLPPDTARPTAPGNVTARVVSPTRVNVSWTASTDNVGVTGYRVLRDGVAVNTVAGGVTTYSDTTMSSGQSHTYLIHALDQAGNVSTASNSAVAQVPAPAASGLTGTYFDTASFTAEKLTRVDPTINFAWGTGSPSTKIAADTFSVRWTGKIIPLANTTYTFYTDSDNGVRLWVNGQLIINSWTSHTLKEDRATISLSASQAYAIKIEYYENAGPATVKLHWSSPGLAKQIIPASQLLAK